MRFAARGAGEGLYAGAGVARYDGCADGAPRWTRRQIPLVLTAVVIALPWIVVPAVLLWRAAQSDSLDDEPTQAPPDPPLVSVIVPARNEARHIAACLDSVLGSTWPRLEVIVVDDHSTDGTGDLARAIATRDPRLRVIDAPPLPADWFGKQWACASGAREAQGEILLFADADTRHAPDLVMRTVHHMRRHAYDLLSVAGQQLMETTWEQLVQPLVFGVLLARLGGTRHVSRATRAEDTIANGQCLCITRAAYAAVGTHAAVRHNVAEDLLLAQAVFRDGRRVGLVVGLDQLSTRMYSSLGEMVRGWRKNVYAGGRYAMPEALRQPLLYAPLLLAPPLFLLAPTAVAILGAARLVPPVVGTAALIAYLATSLWLMAGYAWLRKPLWTGFLHPLGAGVLLWIFAGAIGRGRQVTWKGRDYTSS